MEKPKHQRPLKHLSSGWEARLGLNGRVYYYSLHSQTVQILPPPESWSCAYNLPYGWELALDYSDKPYFINHVLQQVTYDDPRQERGGESDSGAPPSELEAPAPREYTIARHSQLGFGFIAGSEKPVIIRSVSPGGPSEGKLLPGDQIIKIGSEYVRDAAREYVIELIRDSVDGVNLTVLQPTRVANSSFLKPNKRLMKGANRPRVRFADDNGVDGEENMSGSSPLLVVPGTLRVLLEEGPPRSFQFTNDTTAGDIVSALCEKLGIVDSKLYSLVLTPSKQEERRGHRRNRTSDEVLIAPWDCIAKVVANPSVKHHECCFRLTFVSKDIHKLSRDDPRSFRYHYLQCVNDVVAGDVFGEDISQDEALRLASFQMLEVFIGQFADERDENGKVPGQLTKKKSFSAPSKISLKQIEKEYGLARFLSPPILALVNSSQSKEHRKTLQQYLKANFANYVLGTGGGSRSSSPPTSPANERHVSVDSLLLRIRMQYVKILSPHHLYAGRYFDATILAVVESDITLVVGHHYGISQLVSSKTKMASIFADFTCVTSVEVAPCQPAASKTNVRVEFQDMAPLVLAMHPLSAQTFAFMISGYCRVYDNNDMMLTLPIAESTTEVEYFASHKVKMSHWNYPPQEDTSPDPTSSFFYCDFSEPVRSSLLSDQIPLSVRAMYQQSKIPTESDSELADIEDEEESKVVTKSSPTLRPPSRNRLAADDEGVALSHNELSPLSSVSSVNSSSPSSGIGSVTSHQVLAETAQGEQSDGTEGDGEWNELMVALEVSNVSDVSDKEDAPSNVESDENEEIAEAVPTSAAAENEDAILITNSDADVERKEDEDPDGKPEIAEERDSDNAPEREEAPPSPEAKPSPVAVKRNRFSSFKPDEPRDADEEAAGPSTSQAAPASNALTSDQLKEHLVQSSLTLDKDEGQIEPDDDPQILRSPLPVDDLARGHKSLKNSRKQKNRRSWFARDSLPRSFSLDTGLGSSPEPPKRNKSFFRSIFSPSHSYSVKSEKSPSSMSLNRDPMPGAKRSSSRWRLFRSSDSTTPTKRFSFFSFFTRKRRRHTVNISSTDIGSPMAGDQGISGGAYSVFREDEVADVDPGDLKRATSVENVQRRPKEQVSPKDRPVSFMSTFQQLPKDFAVKKSPSRRSGSSGGDSASPKSAQAPFHLPETKLAIKSIQQQRLGEESVVKESPSETEGHPSEDTAIHDYENWGNRTPPVKPARSRKSSEEQGQLSLTDSEEEAGEKTTERRPIPAARPSVQAAEDAEESKSTKGSVKRKAPPPPKVPPPEIDSPLELSPVTDAGSSAKEDSDEGEENEEEEKTLGADVALEPLDLTHLHSDDEATSEEELKETPPTVGGKSSASEGSLMGEIFAYLKTSSDEKGETVVEQQKDSDTSEITEENPPAVGAKEPHLSDNDADQRVESLTASAESCNHENDEINLVDDILETLSNKSEPKVGLPVEEREEEKYVATTDEASETGILSEQKSSAKPGMMYVNEIDESESESDSESEGSLTREKGLAPKEKVETFIPDQLEFEMPTESPNAPFALDKNEADLILPNQTQEEKEMLSSSGAQPRDDVQTLGEPLTIKRAEDGTNSSTGYDQSDVAKTLSGETLSVAGTSEPPDNARDSIVSVVDATDSEGGAIEARPLVEKPDISKDIAAPEDDSAGTGRDTPPRDTGTPVAFPAVATETVASGNGGEIVSTWTFADPGDLPPPPPVEELAIPGHEIATLGPSPRNDIASTQNTAVSTVAPPTVNGAVEKPLWETAKTAATPLYASVVTPKLFGQVTKARGFSRVKPPTAKTKTTESVPNVAQQVLPERNGYGVSSGFDPVTSASRLSRPPIPPKPGHLH